MNILDQSISILDVLSLVTKKQQIKSMELYASLTLYIKIMEPYVRPDTLIYYQENMDLVFKFFRLNDITETKQINQNIIDKFINGLLQIITRLLLSISELGYFKQCFEDWKKLMPSMPLFSNIQN